MFQDKWITLFFMSPFWGDFSLYLHKMVQETSRNLKQAEKLQRHVFWNSLKLWMLTSIHLIHRACWMCETQNCDNKIKYNFNDKSLARYRYKQKQTPWNLDLGYTCITLLTHQILSVITPIFLKLVFVKLPDGMSRWSFELVCEILKVPILSVSSLSSVSEI